MQIKAILRNHTTLTEDSGEDVGEMGTFMGGHTQKILHNTRTCLADPQKAKPRDSNLQRNG